MAQQALGLRSVFPDAEPDPEAGRLSWTGRLQPCDLSRIYTVQITYTRGRYPAVRVLAPQAPGGRERIPAPHLRRRDPVPARRRAVERATMLIVDTIVPWAAEWLLHYEIWLATGEWFGDHDPSTTLQDHYDDLPAP